MDTNFCRRCGAKLTSRHDYIFECTNGHTIYANCSPTVGIFFITDKRTILLSRRGIEPHKGMLDAFGGFLDGEETAEQAATRELQEELELDPKDYEPLKYLTSAIGHYPHEDETLSILSILFWTRLKPGIVLAPHDDVAEIVELPFDKIDFSKLHDEDIRVGIRKLQNILGD